VRNRSQLKCLHSHLAHHLAGGANEAGRWTARALGAQLAEQAVATHRAHSSASAGAASANAGQGRGQGRVEGVAAAIHEELRSSALALLDEFERAPGPSRMFGGARGDTDEWTGGANPERV
jgi:hypothetical protein